MIVDFIEEWNDRVDREGALNGRRMELVQTELTIPERIEEIHDHGIFESECIYGLRRPCRIMRMICGTLVILVLHEEEVTVQTVECVSEEEGHETIRPGVRAKYVQDPEPGTSEADPGQQLKLEIGLGVELALHVVFENEFRQAGVLTLNNNGKKKCLSSRFFFASFFVLFKIISP